ncbi:MAG: hypothetical protein IJY24_07405 [Clostridia bacterium]|nr:hypothetical protein [Clostridia bacterium]
MSTSAQNSRPTEERRSFMWIMLMVNIVFILLLMTLGLVALRVGNTLPENTDILFIVGKDPSFDINDSEGKEWQSGTKVNIFSSEYGDDGEQKTTVVSQDGTKVIAPGVKTEYKFGMYNNGNMAVIYETDIDFSFTLNGEKTSEYTFPLKVRLKTDSGKYLLGGDDEWMEVDEAKIEHHISTLGANCYEGFVFELMWEFEGGNDELDTMYGNASEVSLTLGINTYAEEHLDPAATGGTVIDPEAGETMEYGGTFRWIWLILLMACAAILIFYVVWLLNKRLRKW